MLWGQYTEGTWHFGLKVGLGNTITIAVVGQSPFLIGFI